MTAHDRRPSRVLPRRLQEAHYRFLATSKNLSDQAGPGAILSMDTVCERIGLEDRSVCEGIVEDHIEGGYLL